MASRGLLNLTLDEIIERKRDLSKRPVQYSNRKNNFGRFGAGGVMQSKFKNKDLSTSLSNRLSLARRTGGFNTRGGLRRNGVVGNQLQTSYNGTQRKSVHSRLTINNPRKPLNLHQRSGPMNLTTKNAEDFHPVRITNGAVVKGLRSDTLLLQKLNQNRSRSLQDKLDKLRTFQQKKSQVYERSERRSSSSNWKSGPTSRVSMDVNHGLMVSFANEVVRKPRPAPPVQRPRKYPSPPPSYSSSSSSSSGESDDDDDAALPSTSRRVSNEGPKDPLASVLRLGLERPPPPKPHRQVLDPAVQKEIAALQGYAEAQSVGPGPGVKSFKMMPSRTKSSLNERFTIERNVVND